MTDTNELEQEPRSGLSDLTVGLGIEPVLESKIDQAYAATWGMKKSRVQIRSAVNVGTGVLLLGGQPIYRWNMVAQMVA